MRGIFAIGGKEQDLTVYSLDSTEPLFKARNVKHDKLNLRVPIWVNRLSFISDSANELVVGTGHGDVSLVGYQYFLI